MNIIRLLAYNVIELMANERLSDSVARAVYVIVFSHILIFSSWCVVFGFNIHICNVNDILFQNRTYACSNTRIIYILSAQVPEEGIFSFFITLSLRIALILKTADVPLYIC